MAGRPDEPAGTAEREVHWRTAGDRIQTLLEACAAGGAVAHERAEQLVREVIGLYGAGLERIMILLDDPDVIDRLAADDLVASLLLVHGLHPHDTHRRVSDALDRVRPYLGSHGGDVELLEIADGVLRLAFAGSCKSCPSSAVTLELAVEDAVRAAAPEISAIEVVAAEHQTPAGVIPAESLLARVHPDGDGLSRGLTRWHPVPDLAGLAPGEVGGFLVGDTPEIPVLACRVGDQIFAYRDHCPACDGSLAGAQLHDALVRCPRCQARFDVVHAGAGLDNVNHLDPLPLLTRDGVPAVALRAEPTGASA